MSQIHIGLKMILVSIGLLFMSNISVQAQTPSLVITVAQNDGQSLFATAKKYHDGIGVPTDLTKAHALYKQAAALGNNDARVNLGYMYFVGQGVKQNYQIARQYYLHAAKVGDTDAQRNLALIYKHGLGVDANASIARYWKKRSEGKAIISTTGQEQKKIDLPKSRRSLVANQSIATYSRLKNIASKPSPKDEAINHPLEMGFGEAGFGVRSYENISNEPHIKSVLRDSVAPVAEAKTATLNIADRNIETIIPQKILYMAKWVSPSIAGFLVILMIISAVWFFVQLTHIYRAERHYKFAQLFYEAHRESLRGSYLRTPASHQQFLYPSDPWAISICSLMVRFAIKRNADPDVKCEPSKRIVAALKINPFEARLQTFPLVFMVQERIFADIAYLNEAKLSPVKPFQFQARPLKPNFTQSTPHQISNTLRLVQ
ncbi:MAG: hypothetical protein COA43_13385 [Robiginitomaculum sp.]|nr:MAG: hypothetical protein COA43_13385 [Robiginitomaculum sp.]